MLRKIAAIAVSLGFLALSTQAQADDPCCALNSVHADTGHTTNAPVSLAFIGSQGYAAWENPAPALTATVAMYDPATGSYHDPITITTASTAISIINHGNALYAAYYWPLGGYMTVAQIQLQNGKPVAPQTGASSLANYYSNTPPQLFNGPDALYVTFTQNSVPYIGKIATDGAALAKK